MSCLLCSLSSGINGEALLDALVHNILKVRFRAGIPRVRTGRIEFLAIYAPVRVAEIEERRPVRVDEMLRAVCRNEAAPVDFKVSGIRFRDYLSGFAVEIGIVRSRGCKIPFAHFGRGKAHDKSRTAVPEARYREGSSRRRIRENGVKPRVELLALAVALIRGKREIHGDPRLGLKASGRSVICLGLAGLRLKKPGAGVPVPRRGERNRAQRVMECEKRRDRKKYSSVLHGSRLQFAAETISQIWPLHPHGRKDAVSDCGQKQL